MCQCEEPKNDEHHHRRRLNIQRSRTMRIMSSKATQNRTLASLYDIDWKQEPIGEGAFGHVLLATHKSSGERVAIKRIPKKLASHEDFQREMEALLRIQKWGGHPHICALREHFDEGGYYYLILDLVEGGEMFDHLVNHGAYSEADAARLVREVASALDFLHGIGVVHNDIKPENLMLSSDERTHGVVQIVDFGCAEVEGEDDDDDDIDLDDLRSSRRNGKAKAKNAGLGGFTPAYSSPEAFEHRDVPPLPPADMWALGVIVYIMLTGVHPFDVQGNASDEDIEKEVRDGDAPLPLGPQHPYTRHLSPSARDLIMRLMERNPKDRLSAFEMLHHPWVTGEAASTNVIVGSDKRLNKFKKFKTKLQTQFFADAVGWADEAIVGETRRRTNLIERSFKAFDDGEFFMKKLIPLNRGVLASEVLVDHDDDSDTDNDGDAKLNYTEYSNLLAENMKQKYFPRGHIVYRQGTEGNHMYFINSGTVQVITEDGVTNDRHQGDFFGEGAMLHPLKIRSCTIKCKTPVHVIEINRDYFEKYLASSSGLVLSLREKDKIRRRNRAKALLKLQNGMKSETFKRGETLYKEGDPGDSLFIVEDGVVDISTQGHQVIKATEGNFCGEHSLLTGRKRNTTATCISDECVALRMLGRDFRQLMDAAPHVKESLTDMMNRRDFKKAVVLRLGREFPYDDPRKAFNAVDINKRGFLKHEDIAHIMRSMDEDYTDQEVDMMMHTLDLSRDGKVLYDEFVKVFIGDIRATQSM
eukprot:CAMPEP_0113405670 /NCGR_PEP_ID=MMETSP0013_2-20120614/19077_1 /TAXON_ID=2843 ORGANISM="Skeletonema costatum, Strain 1716" /NCGR_SAMPLE_ID=MMETSP0013_2 /ASSEMBLY_ACC=CAM_ASM_000158 /LENGTH=754 /DNA_ID=CAMNT_0000291415 /DNA_START=132 /DNA_END=2396 /DNA_ORIENTATION=- /assembly_acc=CAM_ASM_000158